MSPKDDTGDRSPTPENSTKPYLLRAIHEWCLDNGFTPHIVVSVKHDEVQVPLQYVKNDKIVLNIHPQSIKQLTIDNDYLLFSARFSGAPFQVTVPIGSVLAVYAVENGQGIVFQSGEGDPGPLDDASSLNKDSDTSKPAADAPDSSSSHLKIVK